jgi:para-nitrobenzyl esterase
MHRAWVAFASTGDAGWPEYTRESLLVQRLDSTWTVSPYSRPDAFAEWTGGELGWQVRRDEAGRCDIC